jgi:hypothetical protein
VGGIVAAVERPGIASLTDLEVLPIRITARARDEVRLPANSGSSLRGAFGRALWDLVCVQRHREHCAGCDLEAACAYPQIFAPRATPGEAGFSGIEDLPRPFVVRGPADRSFAAGAEWHWHATLIGRAIERLPYFALAWRQMGERGIGEGRGRFRLERVESLDLHGSAGATLYDADSGILKPVPGFRLAEEHPREDARSGVIRFLTPTLIKTKGGPVARPEFAPFWKALQLRLSLLRLAHGAGRPQMDFRETIRAAEEIQLTGWSGRELKWERFSHRQGQRVPMQGWVGTAEYAGDLAQFLPALRLGSWLGVGDNCTFGQGHYVIADP